MQNKTEVVIQNMIKFIEEAEKSLQASKIANEAKSLKMDIVNTILTKLEEEVNNED